MSRIIGSPIDDLDTPALLLEVPVLETNLKKMAAFFRNRPCKLRPHMKSHKCAALMRRQLAVGSTVGITCAKLGEADVAARGGCDDVLIANQVVGRRKLLRLVETARRTSLRVAVDDSQQLNAISEAAQVAQVTIGVLVEVNIGMQRCGVPPGEPALNLAQQIQSLRGVTFDGLQAYEGHLVYEVDADKRKRQTKMAMQLAIDTRRLIEQRGIEVAVVSGGSSSTYDAVGVLEGFDEVQAGSYAAMDWRYHDNAPEFNCAMSILARVISVLREGNAVLDVGLKGMGNEFGPPRLKYASAHQREHHDFRMSEEHCTIGNVSGLRTGHAIELIPSHGCTTSNLYRQFYLHEDGKVVDVWPIEAAGAVQ